MLEIKEEALFIADAHYPHHGDAFLDLLQKLQNKTIQTPQLFLMGDNFDLLFGYNQYIQSFSQEAITLLQALSQEIEIIYFEGNHDFCLQNIFPHITVYRRQEQPQVYKLGDKRVGLSHGDKYVTGLGYTLYSILLRHPLTLTLLRPFGKMMIDYRMKKLSKKNICHSFEGFEKRVEAILSYYKEVDIVIEGHFHQSKMYGKYLSLPSLACQNMLARVEDGRVVFRRLS